MRVGAGKITFSVLSALFRYGRLRDRAVFFFRPQDNSAQSGSATKQRCLVRTMRITVETASDSPGPPASADLAVPKVFRNFAGKRKGASRVSRIPFINISRKQQWQN